MLLPAVLEFTERNWQFGRKMQRMQQSTVDESLKTLKTFKIVIGRFGCTSDTAWATGIPECLKLMFKQRRKFFRSQARKTQQQFICYSDDEQEQEIRMALLTFRPISSSIDNISACPALAARCSPHAPCDMRVKIQAEMKVG